jgi:hypothetical protein
MQRRGRRPQALSVVHFGHTGRGGPVTSRPVPTFLELQDDAALLSLEHQLQLIDTVGERDWETDLAEPRFSFTGASRIDCTSVNLLGSAAPGPKSWLWSWANPFGYRREVLELAEQVRAFGEQHNIPEFTTPEVPFDAFPDAPTEPAQVVALIMEATKAATKRWTGYQGPVGGGTRAGFIIDHPQFQLSSPDRFRVNRVLQQGLAELRLGDHRRAFHSYATNRGLDVEHNGPLMQISGQDFEVAVRFNERNLVAAMTSTLSGAGR